MNGLFFLEIGVDLRSGGAFSLMRASSAFRSAAQRLGEGERSEKEKTKRNTGRDGSPSRPSNKSARSESTPYLMDGMKGLEILDIFRVWNTRLQ